MTALQVEDLVILSGVRRDVDKWLGPLTPGSKLGQVGYIEELTEEGALITFLAYNGSGTESGFYPHGSFVPFHDPWWEKNHRRCRESTRQTRETMKNLEQWTAKVRAESERQRQKAEEERRLDSNRRRLRLLLPE